MLGSRSRSRLLSIVYHSAATPGSSSFDLDEILTVSRVRNRASGITGMLLAENGRFVQLLEGPEDEVRELMSRIAADPRHEHVRILAEDGVSVRRFPDWAMAHGHVGEIESLPFEDHLEALLDARDELPGPATTASRLKAWFRARPSERP